MCSTHPTFPFAIDPCDDGPQRDNLPEEIRLMRSIDNTRVACQAVINRHDVRDTEGVLWGCGCPVCDQANGLLWALDAAFVPLDGTLVSWKKPWG
jgi:hypothetical protein